MNPHEELPEEVLPRAYYNQPVWKRIVVILAGPVMNLLIAFVIVWALFLSQGQAVPGKNVGLVESGTPAAAVLRPADEIVSVDGVSGSETAIRDQIATHRCAGAQVNGCHASTPAKVVVRRDGKLYTFEITPRYNASAGRPLLGFEFGSVQQPVGAVRAASLSATGLWGVTKQTVTVVVHIFQPQDRKQLSGIVGGYTVTQESFATSTTDALKVLALISLSLAIINLFPFLPLDGGHIFWAVAEKVRGKRIPFEVMERAGIVGFALILLLFVIGLSNDISTLSGQGFNIH
jgi:regulator of sigma E protease